MDEKNNKKSKNLLILLLIIIMLLVILIGGGFAKYVTRKSGTAQAVVASMGCKMTIKKYGLTETSSEDPSSSVVNPFCEVTVENKDEKGNRTQTDIEYQIKVSLKDGAQEDESLVYYWLEDDKMVAHSKNLPDYIISAYANQENSSDSMPENLIGSFSYTSDESKNYKIVFVNDNVGEEDITKNIDFNLTAEEKMN